MSQTSFAILRMMLCGLLIFSVADVSARADSLPGWVTSAGADPRYPIDRYMTYVGSAPIDGDLAGAMERAIANGKQGLSASVVTSITGELEMMSRETGIGGVYESYETYENRVLEATSSTLYGAERVDAYRDSATNTMYVLLALDRDDQARGILDDARTRLARIVPAEPSASPATRLRALLEEHVVLEGLVPPLMTVAAVISRSHPLRPDFETMRGQVQADLKRVAMAMRGQDIVVRLLSGGGQAGFASEALALPIEFEVRLNGEPLVGFPVRFDLEYPDRAEVVEASRATDNRGRFSCRLNRLVITGDNENDLVGLLDYDAFGAVQFATPSRVATYSLATFGTSTFAVWVSETNQGELQPESAVAGSLRSALAERQGILVELDNYLQVDELARVPKADLRWLQSRLAGKVDYLIRGSARSIYSSNRGPIHFSYAGGRIELIDLRSGARLVSFEQPPSSSTFKAGAGSASDSGVRALRAFAAGAEKRVIGEVDSIFQAQ